MKRLQGKAAIITGAGQGIGRGIARRFAREGARVMIAERNEQTGTHTASELEALGGEGRFIQTDVGEKDQVEAAVAATVDAFGRVDILVNNAWAGAPLARFEWRTSEEMEEALRVGFLSNFWSMQAVFPHMKKLGEGRIINLSSVVGHTGNAGQIPYTMAKAGLDAFTKSLAQELAGREILVNSVAPGLIATDMTSDLPEDVRNEILARVPQGRMGTPEEVAEVVAFLATRGSYINGSVIHVNGGLYGG